MEEQLQQISRQVGEIRECLLGNLADGEPGLVAKVKSHGEEIQSFKTRGWMTLMLAVGAFFTALWKWIFEHRTA